MRVSNGVSIRWQPGERQATWLDLDRRPTGVTDESVEAVGKLGEALERLERARGHLYTFHQMSGTVDLMLGEAAELLRHAGHLELAESLAEHLVGRNVIEGRWSFQIVEEYDATYWSQVVDFVGHAREHVVGGADHVHESEMKERRRSNGARHHERGPVQRE